MRDEVRLAAAAFRLVLPRRPLSGRLGGNAGRGTGSSLELADFREYVPGDDPRHIDWRGFARTDKLHVRLFRAEVTPHLDVVVDRSPSMGSTATKERALRDLGAAFRSFGARAGCTVRTLAAGGDEIQDLETCALDPAAGLDLVPRARRPRAGLTVVISDFLVEGSPVPWVRRLAAESAHLWVVQLLDPWELDPSADGPHTFVDVETGSRANVALSRATLVTYRERLGRLRDALAAATRSSGGSYALVTADAPRAMFEKALLRQGVIEPA